jgi:protein-disulfide isomerase
MHKLHKLVVPFSIIIAGGLIATAIYFTNSTPAASGKPSVADLAKSKPAVVVAPVTAADHIQGSKDAKIVVVEYSDTECPFCKRHHQTLTQIFNDYKANNQVAWVYRHFPLDIHRKSPKEAEATECANELGGNTKFWEYIDMVYDTTTSNDGLDASLLPEFAEKIGLDKAAFTTCLNSGKYTAKITEAKNAGLQAGARGTPYTVLLVKNGSKVDTIPLVDDKGNGLGAVPYATFKNILESFLK